MLTFKVWIGSLRRVRSALNSTITSHDRLEVNEISNAVDEFDGALSDLESLENLAGQVAIDILSKSESKVAVNSKSSMY